MQKNSSLFEEQDYLVKPETEDILPSLASRHPRFMWGISFGFSVLYAELMLFISLYYNSSLDLFTRLVLTFGTFLVSLFLLVVSFSLPHAYFKRQLDRYSPIIFLMLQWGLGSGIIIAGAILQLVVGIFIVNGDLFAISEHIRSLALYTFVVCILVHGSVIFARYVRYLYEREMHQSYKIVTVTGVSAVVILVITLFLLPYDLGRIGANVENSGLVALHITIRDIWLIGCTIYAFMWQVSRLADH
jgi:hypothetical protein